MITFIKGILGLKTVKIGAIAFAVGFVIGGVAGWYEKGLRVAAADLRGQTKAVKVHAEQEAQSQKTGRDTEHAKQKAKEGMASIPERHSANPVGVFDADSVREQADLIAAGETAFQRID